MSAAFGVKPFTYREGSCVVCGTGTDTGIAVVGELAWQAAILHVLGIPKGQAAMMIERDGAPDDEPLYIRICESCCGKSVLGARGLKPALMAHGFGVPALRQPQGVGQ